MGKLGQLVIYCGEIRSTCYILFGEIRSTCHNLSLEIKTILCLLWKLNFLLYLKHKIYNVLTIFNVIMSCQFALIIRKNMYNWKGMFLKRLSLGCLVWAFSLQYKKGPNKIWWCKMKGVKKSKRKSANKIKQSQLDLYY